MFQIKTVETKADWDKFIDLPWKIYANDPVWVPPLKIAVRDVLDVNKNPFFKHAVMKPMLAYRGDEVVGRIVGVIDENHNKFYNEKTAFFGFFEAINDQNLANQLFDEVRKWAKPWGMQTLRGPMNPSTNHECGLLVEGFDNPPAIMMTYNPPYYGKLFENAGMLKAKDLFAWEVHRDANFSDRLLVHAEKLKQESKVKFRTLRMKDYDNEIEKFLQIYNDAWEDNWGFVPMEQEEFRHMAKDMKSVVDPELILVAEINDEAVGFALTLPDVNQALTKNRNGKLFPTGLLKLLWNLKGPGRKKTLNRCRIVTLGVKKKYRALGLGALFYTEYVKRGPALGYPTGEASWILEDNHQMNKALKLMDAKKTKVYRVYDRPLT